MRGFTFLALAASLAAAAPALAGKPDNLRRVLCACEGDRTMEVVFLNTGATPAMPSSLPMAR